MSRSVAGDRSIACATSVPNNAIRADLDTRVPQAPRAATIAVHATAMANTAG
jgi:hypothetical protein